MSDPHEHEWVEGHDSNGDPTGDFYCLCGAVQLVGYGTD